MDREAAWDAVHEAMPAGWLPGPVTYDPGSGEWHVSAVDHRTTGRGKLPRSVTGTGADEVSALHDLDDRLRGVPRAEGRLDELRRSLRLAYVDGAESWSREHAGRALTSAELAGVVSRFPR